MSISDDLTWYSLPRFIATSTIRPLMKSASEFKIISSSTEFTFNRFHCAHHGRQRNFSDKWSRNIPTREMRKNRHSFWYTIHLWQSSPFDGLHWPQHWEIVAVNRQPKSKRPTEVILVKCYTKHLSISFWSASIFVLRSLNAYELAYYNGRCWEKTLLLKSESDTIAIDIEKWGIMIWMPGDVNDNIIISCDCECLLKTAKSHWMSVSSLTFSCSAISCGHASASRATLLSFILCSLLSTLTLTIIFPFVKSFGRIHHSHPLEARTYRSSRTFSSLSSSASSSLRQTPRLIQTTSNTLLRLTDNSLDVAIVATMRRYEYSQSARALMPILAYWVRCPWPPSLSIDKKLFSCYGNR